MVLVWKRLNKLAKAPVRSTAGAAGFDLSSIEEVVILPTERALVRTGIALAISAGHVGDIRPRSGMAANYGVTVLNSPGTIDSDYRGEVCVLLVNHGVTPYTVIPGQRIAQLVITACSTPEVEEYADLDDTARGAGGWGSTG